MEAAVVAHRTSEARTELAESRRSGDPLAVGLIKDATASDTLSKIGRYERSLERSMYRASYQLERLQAAGQAGLKSRATDARDDDHRRLQAKIGELLMETELLYAKVDQLEASGPLARRRSTR